ncbi:serine/threonine-protein kinase Nek4-like isoform X2 [Lineus longissimus]|uniref:serine/threonine-protein kinase Nek4-like isoform X2 n=1 Tax=Lineus longissimus TaxID=88925 RepID=UPI00315CADE9
MSLDDYSKSKVIGKGSYGEVWLSKHKKDKKQYVLKKIDLHNASKRERKAAEQESKLLSRLKHPNIVAYKDSFETGDGILYIAMGFCEGGDLYNRLKEQKGIPLEERQVVEWFVQIAMALQYMHERNILHRDLKTQNIFLTKSKIIKVGDLGIARVLETSSDMATTLIGTPYYMSPELFSNKPYNHKSDVWALGCCVYEMATLKHAFNAKDMNSLVYRILRGKMPTMPKSYSPELLNLIKAMLHQNPDKRPSVNRILRDPYIKRNIAIFLEGTKNRRSSVSSVSSASSVSSSRPSSSSGRPPSSGHPRSQPSSSGYEEPDTNRSDVSRISRVSSASRVSNRSEASNVSNRPSAPSPQGQRGHRSANGGQGDGRPRYSSVGDEPTPSSSAKTPTPTPAKDEPSHRRRRRKGVKDSDSESVASSEAGEDSSRVSKAKSALKPRPLPPRPSSAESTPQLRAAKVTDDSSSSSVTSSKDDVSKSVGDTPRSRPNSAARARRRERKETDTPRTPVGPPGGAVLLRKDAHKSKGADVVDSKEAASNGKLARSPEKKQKEAMRVVEASKARPIRQPSLPNSSSSTTESDSDPEVPEPVKKNNHVPPQPDSRDNNAHHHNHHRRNKEMNNFITLLDTTLRLNKEEDRSPDEDEDDSDIVTPKLERQMSAPTQESGAVVVSPQTLGATGRLMERITALRKDCIRGLGVEKMKKAYDILDNIEGDELEPQLIQLLGKDLFDEYAGKIWQLKFCEETAFGHVGLK